MTWLLEVVDSPAGSDTSIEIDSAGHPWILYSHWEPGWNGVSLAHWTGSSWTYENVGQLASNCLSLALDSFDRPHMVYEYGGLKDMYYAYWDSMSWVYETIDSVGDLGSTCSIALDSLDRPHVSYENFTWNAINQRRDLKYAWRDASGWHTETVDWQGYVGKANSIAVDSSNRPHISYTDVDNDTLKYAWLNGFSWNISTVDDTDWISSYNPTSIRLDSLDRPRIAYMATPIGNDELRYASWDGLSWTIEPAALINSVSGGDSLSLRLDSSDNPSIAYTNHSGFLSYTSKQGVSWVVENIDAGGGSVMGRGASLALDSGGNPHISYTDGAYSILKYAYRGDDSIPPSSSVNQIVPYWTSSSRFITVTATDGQSRVSNVTLWYRFSPDNSSTTWGPWTVDQTVDRPPWSWSFTFPDGEGFYEFYSIANDTGGNTELPPPTADAIAAFDETKPDSVLQSVTAYWFTSSPLQLNATATDNLSGVASVDLYYVYSGNNFSWGSPTLFGTDTVPPWSWDFTFPWGYGWYRLYSQARDWAGNVEDPPSPEDMEVAYDAYPPYSQVEPIPGGWHRFPLTVTADANDYHSGVLFVDLWSRYSPDKVTWSSWTNFGSDTSPPWSWSFTSPNGDGYYEFHSKATDNLSNVEFPKNWSEANASIDTTLPTAIVDPSQPYWKTSSTTITATVTDSLSGVANATLWYRFSPDNVTWTFWNLSATDVSPPWSWLFDFPDGPGHYMLQATAFDNAGNEEPLFEAPEAVNGFDPDAPSASMTVGNPNVSDPPRTWVKSITSLTITAYDANGSGIDSIKNRTWRGGWSPWSDYLGPFTLTGSDGLRYVEFQAFDVAGNSGQVENRTLVLDDTPPATTISPDTGDFTTDTVFTLTATDLGCGVRGTVYRIDGGSPIDYTGGFTLSQGQHTIYFNSIDRLDNEESENHLDVTVNASSGPPTRPDYLPVQPVPSTSVRTGMSMSVSLSIKVHNQGNATATATTRLAFYNDTTPATPFRVLDVSPIAPGGYSSSFTATWTSPAIPGTYRVSVNVDHYNDAGEWDESNNVYSWMIYVVEGPITSLVIGAPNYTSTVTFVRSTTPLDLSVVDQGRTGILYTRYRIDNGTWTDHSGQFFLAGEGEHYIEWYSEDNSGNVEEISSIVLTVDDTPPATTMHPATGDYTTDTMFTLTATDGGSGVNVTRYRIDGGAWTTYSGSFTLIEGTHNVSFYSIDMLDNTEAERWREVTISGEPPPEVEANFKPVVAVIFAIILMLVGFWSARRRPWKGGEDGMAVVKAFTVFSLPFVLAEVVTGIVSFITGQLSIPPPIGIGTAVDLAILLTGVTIAILRTSKPRIPNARVSETSKNR